MAFTHRIYDQQGVYFVTCTVAQWVDVFTRKDYADIIVASLKYCQQNKGLNVYGWVIMTNHVHLIVSCGKDNNLSDVLRDFKKYTASRVFKAIEANPRESRRKWLLWLLKDGKEINFWQLGYHGEEIYSREFFLQKLQYIHNNPVRAGIVNSESAYLYSSASHYQGLETLIELNPID